MFFENSHNSQRTSGFKTLLNILRTLLKKANNFKLLKLRKLIKFKSDFGKTKKFCKIKIMKILGAV